jgi:hypothetical protein
MENLTVLHPGGVLEPEDLAGDFEPAGGAVRQLSSLPWKEAREQYLASFELSYAQAVLAVATATVSAGYQRRGARGRRGSQDVLRHDTPQAGPLDPQARGAFTAISVAAGKVGSDACGKWS